MPGSKDDVTSAPADPAAQQFSPETKQERLLKQWNTTCGQAKQVYDTCFYQWFSEYLKQDGSKLPRQYRSVPCEKQWSEYQDCLKKKEKALKWQFREKLNLPGMDDEALPNNKS